MTDATRIKDTEFSEQLQGLLFVLVKQLAGLAGTVDKCHGPKKNPNRTWPWPHPCSGPTLSL